MTTLLIYNISDFCNLGILFCSSSILDKIVSHIILLSLIAVGGLILIHCASLKKRFKGLR